MDWQTAFNVAVLLSGALGGWVLKWIGDSLKALRDTNASLAEKVQHIEVLVAGSYARKEDVEKASSSYKESLDRLTSAIFTKLDRIEEKLDKKVDK